MDEFTVVAWCPGCDNARYKSKRLFKKGERPSPEDFIQAHPEQVPPETFDARTPITCSSCGSVVKFVNEAALGQREGPPQRNPSPRLAAATSVADAPLETLFAVAADEQIKEMRETPSGMVIITSKRIVRLQI